MSPAYPADALRLPATSGWDFSDYPYGLEPLTLPYPDNPVRPSGHPTPAEFTAASTGLLQQARDGFPTTLPADDLERLFWFRWMIGHHISFVVWRLLADALARVHKGEGDQELLAEEITRHTRTYCGMLLYTGSSTRAIYQAMIRPSMYRLHSTFSGTWAPDYPPVRSHFRGRKAPPVPPSASERVMRQVRLSNRIHFGVSSKLVTEGRSLLQQSIDAPDAAQPRMWGAIFDCYFLTLRAPVTTEEITTQLLRRVKAVGMDLATNGLYPGATEEPEETPEELREADVLACERDLPADLAWTAALAAGISPEAADRELGRQ